MKQIWGLEFFGGGGALPWVPLRITMAITVLTQCYKGNTTCYYWKLKTPRNLQRDCCRPNSTQSGETYNSRHPLSHAVTHFPRVTPWKVASLLRRESKLALPGRSWLVGPWDKTGKTVQDRGHCGNTVIATVIPGLGNGGLGGMPPPPGGQKFRLLRSWPYFGKFLVGLCWVGC